MILNQPTKSDFEEVAKENLIHSFDFIFQIAEQYANFDDSVKKVSVTKVWRHHKGKIRTSLILLHQAIEGLMKASICRTSALLLIDKPRKDWPTYPASGDKEFDSLYTIGGEALVATFCAVESNVNRDEQFINFIDHIRQIRNQAVHGTDVGAIHPKEIVEGILKTYTAWFGKDAWLKEIKNNFVKDPLLKSVNSEFKKTLSIKYLDLALAAIKENQLSEHLNINIKSRGYYCPTCNLIMEQETGKQYESKWAFLNPNKHNSNKIICVNCNNSFKVLRQDCEWSPCKGNVLYEMQSPISDDEDLTLCLTCWEFQSQSL